MLFRSIHGSKRHPLRLRGAREPRSLRIPLNSRASRSSFPFKAYFSPGEPRLYSVVEWAHPGCWETPSLSPWSSNGSIGPAAAFVCRRLVCCSTLGKIKAALHCPPPLAPLLSWSFILHRDASPHLIWVLIWNMESLKVIAFDKTSVNKDFSSGNQFPHIP